jgi:hypothetical protein
MVMEWRRIEGLMAIGTGGLPDVHLMLRAVIGPAIVGRADQGRNRNVQKVYI